MAARTTGFQGRNDDAAALADLGILLHRIEKAVQEHQDAARSATTRLEVVFIFQL